MDVPQVTTTPAARSFLRPINELAGQTPLVQIGGPGTPLDTGPCRILAKLEYLNPTGSIKDRVASELIADAEHAGRLRPGMTIVEGSSGNATIAIGAVARRRGYRVLAFVPRAMSEEKKRLHRALGVECEFFEPDPTRPFRNIRRDAAVELAERHPDRFVCFDQFSNPVNVRSHERSTGAEIWRQVRQLGGGIDAYFAGAGTGGSLVGISRALKRPGRFPRLRVVMVDPAGSTLADRFNGRTPSTRMQAAPDGLGERYLPGNLDVSIIDDAVSVSREDAVRTCAELVRASGILGGPCTGYTLHTALHWCRAQTESRTALILICDRGENYLSDAQYAEAIDTAYRTPARDRAERLSPAPAAAG
ncbi:MAG: PLP-dependent cysteine synthase family protein [Phycisphaerales bacterium]